MCHVLKQYKWTHFCVSAASSTEPKPFNTIVGHLNVGSVGRLDPTMSCIMPGRGFTQSCSTCATSCWVWGLSRLTYLDLEYETIPVANHYASFSVCSSQMNNIVYYVIDPYLGSRRVI